LNATMKSILSRIESHNVRDHVNVLDMCALACGLQDYSPLSGVPITPCSIITSFYCLELYATLASVDGHLWSVLDMQELWPKEFFASLVGIGIYYMWSLLLFRFVVDLILNSVELYIASSEQGTILS